VCAGPARQDVTPINELMPPGSDLLTGRLGRALSFSVGVDAARPLPICFTHS
jgi:hypothetical protein